MRSQPACRVARLYVYKPIVSRVRGGVVHVREHAQHPVTREYVISAYLLMFAASLSESTRQCNRIE